MTARQPSPSKVARYVREEMLDGASVDDVMAGNQRGNAAVATVRWRVWVRLLADGYSLTGIARRFSVDHTSILWAKRQMAKGRLPFNGAVLRLPAATPQKPAKPPGLIVWVGHDPTEQRLRSFL